MTLSPNRSYATLTAQEVGTHVAHTPPTARSQTPDHYELCQEVFDSSQQNSFRMAHVVRNRETGGIVHVVIEQQGVVKNELVCGGTLQNLFCSSHPESSTQSYNSDTFSLKQIGSQRLAVFDTVRYLSKGHGVVFYCFTKNPQNKRQIGFSID